MNVSDTHRLKSLEDENANGSLRDELLNEELFHTLDDARRKLALWRYDYNNVRPHSSLGTQTPA
jgi:putative transposase